VARAPGSDSPRTLTVEPFASRTTSRATVTAYWSGSIAAQGRTVPLGPLDLLERVGLLKYGAMLDPSQLRAALKSADWKTPAIAGVMGWVGSRGGQADMDTGGT